MLAEDDGVVTSVSADSMSPSAMTTASVEDYPLIKFARSNQGTCINQRPIVAAGETREEGRGHGRRPLHRPAARSPWARTS